MHYSLRLLTDFQCLKYTSSIAFYPTPIYLVLSLLSFFAITHTELAINPCITVQRLVANMRRGASFRMKQRFQSYTVSFPSLYLPMRKARQRIAFRAPRSNKAPFPCSPQACKFSCLSFSNRNPTHGRALDHVVKTYSSRVPQSSITCVDLSGRKILSSRAMETSLSGEAILETVFFSA